jgi:hypothetical protein
VNRVARRKARLTIVPGSKSVFMGFRMGDVEAMMLDRLIQYWGCDRSEALRRCIVYTYLKFLMGSDVSEESLMKVVEEYLRFREVAGFG